jgi:F-type H+-transporting ATPase subunit epsilon
MADVIHLELVVPSRVVAQAEVSEVEAPGLDGEFGVLPGHAYYISALKPGEVRFRQGDRITRYVVGRGFAEVGPDHATILADFAEEAGSLNAGEIQEALDRDEARLKSLSAGDPEAAVLIDRMERNQARLAVASSSSSH